MCTHLKRNELRLWSAGVRYDPSVVILWRYSDPYCAMSCSRGEFQWVWIFDRCDRFISFTENLFLRIAIPQRHTHDEPPARAAKIFLSKWYKKIYRSSLIKREQKERTWGLRGIYGANGASPSTIGDKSLTWEYAVGGEVLRAFKPWAQPWTQINVGIRHRTIPSSLAHTSRRVRRKRVYAKLFEPKGCLL